MHTLKSRTRRFLLPLLVTMGMASGLILGPATSVFADYGAGAQYQVEISDNCNGLQSCQPGQGNGIWLWVGLNANGTGDYQAASCVHGLQTPNGTISTASHDSGDVTWTSDGTTLTITGVVIIDGTRPLEIKVPAKYGHYVKTPTQIFPTFPIVGMAQVQVAP